MLYYLVHTSQREIELSVSSDCLWFGLIPVLAVVTQILTLKKFKGFKIDEHVTCKHYSDLLKTQNIMYNFLF